MLREGQGYRGRLEQSCVLQQSADPLGWHEEII